MNDMTFREDLMNIARDMLEELRKQTAPDTEILEASKRRQHHRRLCGYAVAAHQGLLASGKWRPEEHRDLVARAWDLAEQMMEEDEHRLGGDDGQ